MSEITHTKDLPERQLVLLCSQTALTQEQTGLVSDILERRLDWNYIFLIAGRSGVLPLVSWNLIQKFPTGLDSDIKERLSNFYADHTKNNLYLTHRLIEIVKTAEKNGISLLPFKGTTLSVRAYGNFALRHYCDLDILVKPKKFDETVKLLKQSGYTLMDETNWFKRKTLFFTHKKDVNLKSADGRVQIELHWKLSGSHFSMPLEISHLWDKLEKINLGGTEMNSLSFSYLFIYLCLHGSRHEWERLSWICDVRELIRSEQDSGKKIDWLGIRENAVKYGCERVVELGLFLIEKFFGIETEYPGFENIKKDKTFHKILEQVKHKIFDEVVSPSKKEVKYSYLLSLQEKRTHRLKLYLVYLTYYLKLMFTPNSMDKSIFHLPAFLYPFYFILRPIRLLFTYFSADSDRKSIIKNSRKN